MWPLRSTLFIITRQSSVGRQISSRASPGKPYYHLCMSSKLQNLLQRAQTSPLTWHPVEGGQRAWICFDDDKTYDLGPDPDAARFNRIADRMMSGRYYPPDAVQFVRSPDVGDAALQSGERILQRAPLFCRLGGPLLNSAVEIYVAMRTSELCRIGYVTTDFHYGRGIWTAELIRSGDHLRIRVWSTASPHSILFWLGLPIARAIQLRARRRAIEEFRKL